MSIGGMERWRLDVRDEMRRRSRWTGSVLLASSLSCMPAVGDGHPEAAPEDRPSERGGEARSEEWGLFEIELDGRLLRPSELAPAPGTGRHAEHAGWSADGLHFVRCRSLPGDCHECRRSARDGATESFESGPGCAQGIPQEQLDARLAAVDPGPGAERWRWGSEVVLVVETREHEQTNAGQPRPMLKVGARLRDGGPVAWMLHVDPCEGCGLDQICVGRAHLDAISLSPDGHEVAVLVHTQGNDGSDPMRLERLVAERLADAARAPASRAAP